MDYAWFLFDFDGRINRAKFWLSALIIVCWILFLGLLVLGTARIFGGTLDQLGFDTGSIFRIVDPTAYQSAFEIIRNGHSTSADNLIPLSFYAIGTPLFLWVYLATSVKRLHDRNKSAWWMIPFFVVPGLFGQFGDWLSYSYGVLGLGILVTALSIWGFVELCCLRGTTGPNRYGADPLVRFGACPRWDQRSELEFIPQRAHEADPTTSEPPRRSSHGKREIQNVASKQ